MFQQQQPQQQPSSYRDDNFVMNLCITYASHIHSLLAVPRCCLHEIRWFFVPPLNLSGNSNRNEIAAYEFFFIFHVIIQ